MATAGVRVEKAPVGGSLAAGFVIAVCCGGLPLFASIGLGVGFAGLRLWRFVPVFLALGTAVIVALNWVYYRGKAQVSGASTPLRRAMFVSTGVGLAFMAGGVILLDRLENVPAVHDKVEHYMEGDNEEPSGASSRALVLALASFPLGLLALRALPFPGSGGGAGGQRPVRKGLEPMDVKDISQEVRRRYGAFAETGGHKEACCAATAAEAASAYAVDQGLYGDDELALVPEGALDLSRGCGNPTGFAALAGGEAVVDFGCGGGIDVILAAHKVGPEGRVVGVDFTPQMIERARENVAKAGVLEGTAELRVADMTATGLPDALADVVISNCVINLCPVKEAVYREAFRILRPGGRLAISDVVLSEAIDPDLQDRFRATWAGCMGGAVPEADYLEMVRRVGFTDVEVVARHSLVAEELDAMARCPGPDFAPPVAADDLVPVQGKVVSMKFKAVKPAGV
jgi:SAM-dependent methyltransferase